MPKGKTNNPNGRPRTIALELPVYDSMQQMAGATGIPLHVLKWSKRQGCRFMLHSRAHLGDFIKWFFARESQEGEEANEDWTKREKRAAALLKEVKLAEERGRVIDFAVVDAFVRHLTAVAFFGELDRLANEWPAGLKGKDENGIKAECDLQIERTKKGIEDSVKKWTEGKQKKGKK